MGNGSESSERLPPRSSSQPPPPPHHHHHRDTSTSRDQDKNHETVCNLLSMLTLGMDQHQEASTSTGGSSSGAGSATLEHNRMLLLNLTNSPESCIALRRAGCIPLLIEILHPPSSPPVGIRPPEIIKTRAARALKNIVQFNPDEKLKRKELRVLKLLEGIRAFSEAARSALQALSKDKDHDHHHRLDKQGSLEPSKRRTDEEGDDDPALMEKLRLTQQHPTANMTSLMKLSFDEEHRNIMCLLGAIHALADLIVSDHLLHGNAAPKMKDECLLIRRYSGMTLTNLTFGDGTNKALLCGMKDFMESLVLQLQCDNEEVCQVTASVLRNLSWHADSTSRASLRDSNAVSKLTLAAIKSTKESTLKATLSALWNLSAHSVTNKTAICSASPESLPFLISLLRPNNPLLKSLKTPMTIIENAGGILRNISSQICTSPEHRKVLRENHCFEILLEHLKSCSLIVVSNACGTLWNLSGGVGCEEDQRKLLDLNAVPMLKNLIYSKHERISQGASAALRNLLSSRFAKDYMLHLDSRLTAQIYSPTNPSNNTERGLCSDSNQESPGSDGEFDFEFENNGPHQQQQQQQQRPPQYHQHQQQQMLQQPSILHHHEPPIAHQQSSFAAASIFHRIHSQQPPAHSVSGTPTHFHSAQNFAHPGNFINRPTSINYSTEPEPLDLTLTSAKSSPIHIISAAEFGGIGHHHQHLHHSHRKPKPTPYAHQAQYHTTGGGNNQNKQFFNPPNLLHHHQGSSSAIHQSNSQMRFNYPGAKFNRSCPEILSRISSGHPQMNTYVSPPPESKPLDFSSNSHSASSSLRGAGEAAGSHPLNDSGNGGGDTTFNYSLQFTELDDEDRANVSGNGEGTSKSEDTLKTYCYEGTPHNFSISNSCQDLVNELELEKVAAESSNEKGSSGAKSQKLQPIDEAPKSYYVENTPAVFSRTSSLSSINSSGGLNAGENKAEPVIVDSSSASVSIDGKKPRSLISDETQHFQSQNIKRKSAHQHGSYTPARVTFSAEETPLMFSRCSSVASLDSLDVGVLGNGNGANGLASHNDDDLSDFSRRASEVVSPSDLPDSPRAMAPPVRIYDQPVHNSRKDVEMQEKHEDGDDIKVFAVEEKSGLNSCRSLSPLMIDGEVLPVIGKGKLKSDRGEPVVNSAANAKNMSILEHSSNGRDEEGNINKNEASIHTLDKKKSSAFPDDEVKIFAMEGTPFYGVSNATSLSDLTMDLDNTDGQKHEISSTATTSNIQLHKQVVVPPVPAPRTDKSKQAAVAANNAKLSQVVQQQQQPVQLEAPPVALSDSNPNQLNNEPIYSDVQLLQKCIRLGKSAGIPKSKSEYKISGSESMEQLSSGAGNNAVSGSSTSLTTSKGEGFSSNPNNNKKSFLVESKSQHDFDDPDLAALIMKGRNRPKEKERGSSSKSSKSHKLHNIHIVEKEDISKKKISLNSTSESDTSKSHEESKDGVVRVAKENAKQEIKEVDEKSQLSETLESSNSDQFSEQKSTESNSGTTSTDTSGDKKAEIKINNPNVKAIAALDPNQVSTTSLGSEWNDETPTFSSPLPSMSISTAFKIVGGSGVGLEDSVICDKDKKALMPTSTLQKQPHTQSLETSPAKNATCQPASAIQSSLLTMSIMNNELLDSIDPPSTFSNLVSSSDCILPGSPQLNPKFSASDKLNKKWKALTDAANNSSVHSNLSGQKPPVDLDLENSMISVASIKSEIYEHELSSATSYTNDIFQSAVEEIGSPVGDKAIGGGGGGGDLSIGGNTYTIFPPDMGDNGKSTDVVSDGGNTVVSDDFTDAEEIEDFETAPAEDYVNCNNANVTLSATPEIEKLDSNNKSDEMEKSDTGKPEEDDNSAPSPKPIMEEAISKIPLPQQQSIVKSNALPSNLIFQTSPQPKPLMEVHPLESGNKYNTFKVNKSPMSPKASPKQKRREDPERYKTHTIAALNAAKSLLPPPLQHHQNQAKLLTNDSNGNPVDHDSRFATFRVGGPKIVKPIQNANSTNSTSPSLKSSRSNSPDSTPGNSPKGIRGRRKPLYSSLPPSAIAAKKKMAPPIPPKPAARNSSPVRPPSAGGSSATGSSVYVRPTRTSELRCAANSSRESSPAREGGATGGGKTSRTSSNSSLNLINNIMPSSHKIVEHDITTTLTNPRPKVAPKPPVRTTPSVSSANHPKPFSGSSYNVLIKTSNSSFGFGQQRVGDGSVTQNMKGYSTLPKSSKLGGDYAGMYMPGSVSSSISGESKESIPGSEKSQSKMGKLTNLFRKMDFHRNNSSKQETHSNGSTEAAPQFRENSKQFELLGTGSEKKSSKFSNFFGRKKDKSQPKPFLDPGTGSNVNTITTGNTDSVRSASGIWVRRDGENKAMVAPFNYVPPSGHHHASSTAGPGSNNHTHFQHQKDQNRELNVTNNTNTSSAAGESQPTNSSNSSAAPGSAKITTV